MFPLRSAIALNNFSTFISVRYVLDVGYLGWLAILGLVWVDHRYPYETHRDFWHSGLSAGDLME